MKDKIKLNNALDNIDERFIEEAANISGKHEHSALSWLKYAAIPAGCTAAAAAALVCILAAGSNKSRGVDLVAQSNPSSQISQVSQTSQTEFSAADVEKNSGKHFAYYDFESATLELNVDDGTFTLYPVDNLNLILIPSGTFTVSENYISLYFTQFDDVKYRGRLSGDGREITILNPDEWLYGYMYLKITPPTGEAQNDGYVIDYPEIVFRYYDGTPLLVSGTSESVESVENVESAESAETSAAEEIISDSESPESASRFGWVVGGDGGEISEMMYGYGGYYAHKGIDIAADLGTPALAGDDGTVILADWYYGYGRCVMIDHGDLVTLYAHLDEISVAEGQEVSRGDIIGTVGKTGEVSNPSLHFEVRQRISGESAEIAEVIETGETSESGEYEYLNPTDYLPQHRMAASLRISE